MTLFGWAFSLKHAFRSGCLSKNYVKLICACNKNIEKGFCLLKEKKIIACFLIYALLCEVMRQQLLLM